MEMEGTGELPMINSSKAQPRTKNVLAQGKGKKSTAGMISVCLLS